ncbi:MULTISPECIES: hypothetical protein [Flavobacteriaceae]|uniref:hypothetical protein n=1 Tax=Flavobacteriaceae TaxID=49546 RepID=UPI003A956403
MTETDIDKAIAQVLKDKALRKEIGIDKFKAYDLKRKSSIAIKLEVLWQAGKLKLNESTPETHQ